MKFDDIKDVLKLKLTDRMFDLVMIEHFDEFDDDEWYIDMQNEYEEELELENEKEMELENDLEWDEFTKSLNNMNKEWNDVIEKDWNNEEFEL